jgi:hypothetical protein
LGGLYKGYVSDFDLLGEGRWYGWEMARMNGDVSSKASDGETKRHDNARHRKRLIVVDCWLWSWDRLGDAHFCCMRDHVSDKAGMGICP